MSVFISLVNDDIDEENTFVDDSLLDAASVIIITFVFCLFVLLMVLCCSNLGPKTSGLYAPFTVFESLFAPRPFKNEEELHELVRSDSELYALSLTLRSRGNYKSTPKVHFDTPQHTERKLLTTNTECFTETDQNGRADLISKVYDPRNLGFKVALGDEESGEIAKVVGGKTIAAQDLLFTVPAAKSRNHDGPEPVLSTDQTK